jgi:hypothetical protein
MSTSEYWMNPLLSAAAAKALDNLLNSSGVGFQLGALSPLGLGVKDASIRTQQYPAAGRNRRQ